MNNSKKAFSLDSLLRYSTLFAFLLVFIFFSVSAPIFFTASNLLNILSQASVLLLTAVGLTFIVTIGGVDLSLAATYGIGAMVAVMMLKAGIAWPVAVICSALSGMVFGAINSVLVVKIKMSIWLATLGTLFIGESFEKIMTKGGAPIYFPKMAEGFKFLGRGSLFIIEKTGSARLDLKISFVIALVVALVAFFVLNATTFGRALHAIGSQKEAASISGVPVDRYSAIAFMICGACCALGGMIGASILTAYVPVSGRYYLMDSIGAVFVGSTLDKRGFANIPGTLVGVLFFGIMSNGLNLVGINFYWQAVARGMLILIILALDSYRISLLSKVRKS